MIQGNYNSGFPSQVVPDEEKMSWEYGTRVGRAIEYEWFRSNRGGDRFSMNFANFHNLRLYARGEQSIQKYKDELSINGDLSYLNLDWKPVPIIPKFVDIVVNGMSQRDYDVKAYAQDPESQKKRTNYAEGLLRDIQARSFLQKAEEQIGMNLWTTSAPENLPENKEELSLHMQLTYKQSIEIADLYYVGEVKMIHLADLQKQFPDLSADELKKIEKFPGTQNYLRNWNESPDMVAVLFFEYKTYSNQVFKIKHTDQGLEKALEKTDFFNPPPSDNFERLSRSIEVLYSGAKVLGIENMLSWEVSQNMTRPFSNMTKVNMNYQICAPRMYKGRIESLVGRITQTEGKFLFKNYNRLVLMVKYNR